MKLKLLMLFALLGFKAGSQNKDSLLISKYYDAGMPSLTRDWSGPDYKNAIDIIIEGKNNKTLKMPDHKTAPEIFNKITDHSSYWFLESTSIPDATKLAYCGQVITPLTKLFMEYYLAGNNANKKLKYGHEVAVCNITLLKLMDHIMIYSQKMIAEGGLTQAQKDGFAQVKHGTTSAIAGMFETVEKDYIYYETKDVCSVAEAFFQFYNKNRQYLDETTRNEFDKRTTNLAVKSKLPCIKSSAVITTGN